MECFKISFPNKTSETLDVTLQFTYKSSGTRKSFITIMGRMQNVVNDAALSKLPATTRNNQSFAV